MNFEDFLCQQTDERFGSHKNSIIREILFGVTQPNGTVVCNTVTDEELFAHPNYQQELDRLEAKHAAVRYVSQRQPEYPSLADLADALYWSNQGDNTKLDEYYAACAAVKAKYPKPEVN